MRTRFIGLALLVVLIACSLPSRARAGDDPARPERSSAVQARPAGADHEKLAQAQPAAPEGGRPVDLERRKARSRFQYLMLGYGLIWVSLGAYLFRLNRGVNRVGREIDELQGRLEDLRKTEGGSRR